MRGNTHLLGPDDLGAIAARKVATRCAQITWQGSLDQLARVEPVTEAELLTSVRIDRSESAKLVAPVLWKFDSGALDAYRETFRRFVEAARVSEAEARNAARSHQAQCAQEKRRYVADGGDFAGGGIEPTSGDRGMADCNAEVGRFEAHASRLQKLRASPPHPDSLAKAADEKRDQETHPVFDFAVQVRLIAARDLRLLWMGDLRIRTATTAEAVGRTAARINEELARLRQAGTATMQPPPIRR